MLGFFFYFYIIIIFSAIFGALAWIFLFFRRSRGMVKNALNLKLYEIAFPQEKKEKAEKNIKEFISAMEQFYSGMSLKDSYFILEIGLPYNGDEVVFYSAVPRLKSGLFEKQMHGLFPFAKISAKEDDYNIFRPEGESLGSIASLRRSELLPIKTYERFESDPLNVLTSSFSKLRREGEGAAMQMIISPSSQSVASMAKSAASKIREGKNFIEASKASKSFFGATADAVGEMFLGSSGKKEEMQEKIKPVDEEAVKLLETKASREIFSANIRLLASAQSKERADMILSEIEGAFSQFSQQQGNSIKFIRPPKKALKTLFYKFSFRLPENKNALRLNSAELATIFHFPADFASASAPQVKYARFKEAAPPLELPASGLLLGKSVYRGQERNVYIRDDDRRRHFYIIGQTGTGKSVLLKDMAVQDIEAGKGVCFIDPHGSDIHEILSRIPKERLNDLIYFNPGNPSMVMGLNMLEYDPNYPEQKTFIVNELLGIFNKLFDMKTAGGPMFEQYFRNSAMLVMDDPDSGNTLLEISRVLSDKSFREYKLSKCSNPIVKDFWREVAEKAGGEASLQNMVPYITSKFDTFLSNEIMRPIVSQERSAFNFRQVMDEGKILLVNLSKGRLGDINSNLIGLIIVGKLLMASLSRVDLPEEARRDFYLYIDEFQNVTTDSIAAILSEARKYRLNLTIAHQYIGQLEENIRKAVFGNVGSMAVFRIGSEDGEFMEKQFEPVFDSNDLTNLDNYNACVKLLIDGQTSRPFNMQTLMFKKGGLEWANQAANFSASRYGKTRREVEEEIDKKYQKQI